VRGQICEVLTVEYVDALAAYVVERLPTVPGTPSAREGDATVRHATELGWTKQRFWQSSYGAGNRCRIGPPDALSRGACADVAMSHAVPRAYGMPFSADGLSLLVQQAVETRWWRAHAEDLPHKFVATDIVGSTGDVTRGFLVEEADVETALARYRPALVLASWMSMGTLPTLNGAACIMMLIVRCRWQALIGAGVDWTRAIRATPSVQEYLLIGEVDFGVSGTPWETWGIPLTAAAQNEAPPYEQDGFLKVPLGALSVLQIARSDTPYVRFHSQTISFRRQPAKYEHDEL